jgi:hypothetical protein
LATSTTQVCTIPVSQICEIVNLDATNSARFHFTPAGATTAEAATTADRVLPPNSVAYEFLPVGASFVAVLAVAGTPTLTFTPGTWMRG